jgi:hypothetical protein
MKNIIEMWSKILISMEVVAVWPNDADLSDQLAATSEALGSSKVDAKPLAAALIAPRHLRALSARRAGPPFP